VCNGESAYYITNTGAVYVSGENYYGELGLGSSWAPYGEIVLQPDIKLPHNTSYPRVNNLSIIDEALDEVESAYYAFVGDTAVSGNNNQVPEELWVPFDIDVPAVFLSPNSNDTYHLYVKLIFKDVDDDEIAYRDNETHEKIIGPFEVTGIKGESDSYSYVSGDIRVMEGFNAEFNLVFVPSQDMTLGNTDTKFSNIFTEDKLSLQVLDKDGNPLKDEEGNVMTTNSKAVFYIHKNGKRIDDEEITPNYKFVKRDPGSDSDNIYMLRVAMGGDIMKRENGTSYQIKFNGLKGLTVDGTNQPVTINSHPFSMMVYLTELADLT